MDEPIKFVLASASPRRRELLVNLGIPFSVVNPNIDETCDAKMSPAEMVVDLAVRKALAGCAMLESSAPTLVLGSDTVVAIDGQVLGKPVDNTDARRMLNLLSGRSHSVFTGIALAEICEGVVKGIVSSAVVETVVKFRNIPPGALDSYANSGDSLDKAGAYGIQGGASAFVIELLGDYFNVVGLPVSQIAVMLEQRGLEWWRVESWQP